MEVDISDQPIGAGRAAEVFTVGDDRVVKVLRPGWPDHLLDIEEAKARAAHAAGIASPAVLGRVVVAGRPGLVFERVPATSVLDRAFADVEGALLLADGLADLQVSLFARPAIGLPDIKEVIADHIDDTDLAPSTRRAAKDALCELPDGGATVHYDFHPGNVMAGDDDWYVIDWANAGVGAPAADVARTLVLMTPAAAGIVVDVDDEVSRLVAEFADRYRARVMTRSGLTDAEIARWRLPVIAARLHEAVPSECDLYLAEITRLVD